MLFSKNKFSLKTKKPLILASNSVIRKKILKGAGLEFKTIPSTVDEELIKKKFNGKSYNFISKKLAQAKALEISKRFNNFFVIGADQICVFKTKLLDKPLTKRNAIKQLTMLTGKEHKQISGFCVSYNDKIIFSSYEIAKLKMRNLSKKEIRSYVDFDSPLKSCGSYKFESKGYLLFSKIIGNHYTIQGLPILSLFNFLLKKNIIGYD